MILRYLSAIALLSLSVMADGNEQQVVYIEADKLEIDDAQGVSIYQGNVRLTRGALELTADKLTLLGSREALKKMIADGSPVRFKQQLSHTQGEMRAVAKRMEYAADSEKLFLHGEAQLWQGGNEFSGDYIEYHVHDETVIAHSGENDSGRVRVIIQPSTEQPAVAE